MVMLAIQTFLLVAIAFILGCIIGCLLHWLFGANTMKSGDSGSSTESAATETGTSAAVAAGAASAGVASAVSKPAPAPAKAAESATPKPVAASTPAPKPKAAAKPKAASKPKAAAKPKTASAKPKAAAKATPAASLGSALKTDPNDEKAKVADKLGERPPALKAARGGKADDLKMVKGIGPQNESRLNALGTFHFDQIASWNKKQAKWVGSYLAFPGRIEREEWTKQAKVLAKGAATEFSKRVASGKVASSKGKAAKLTGALAGKKPRTLSAARKAGADKLSTIDGVGNAIEKRLNEIGVYHFDQIAKWTPENAAWISNEIGFPGRVDRENWVSEAKKLAK